MIALLEQALELPVDERRRLADDIYESIDRSTDFCLTPEQEAELARRVKDYENNPGGGVKWEEVREAALAR